MYVTCVFSRFKSVSRWLALKKQKQWTVSWSVWASCIEVLNILLLMFMLHSLVVLMQLSQALAQQISSQSHAWCPALWDSSGCSIASLPLEYSTWCLTRTWTGTVQMSVAWAWIWTLCYFTTLTCFCPCHLLSVTLVLSWCYSELLVC